MQDFGALSTSFKQAVDLHRRRSWRHGPVQATNLELISWGEPEDVSIEALAELLSYGREIGVDLELQGGGSGCFSLIFGSQDDGAAILERAILEDPRFKALLDATNANIARVRHADGYRTFAKYDVVQGGLITNRKRDTDEQQPGLSNFFLGGFFDELTYALVEFHVLDPNERIERRGKSIWKKIAFSIGFLRDKKQAYEISRIDILNREEFIELIKRVDASSILVSVHGYANSFKAATTSFATLAWKTHIHRNGYFPILFSWPSIGKTIPYHEDTTIAAVSQNYLGAAIETVMSGAGSRSVSVMAHSHGSKMLVEVGRDRAHQAKQPCFKRMIFVEPDVDEKYMSANISAIMRATQGLTLYHTNGDLALKISEIFFGAKRAGQVGVVVDDRHMRTADIEIVDASSAAVDFVKHAPHTNAPKVVCDIREVLQGKPPNSRGLSASPIYKFWVIDAD